MSDVLEDAARVMATVSRPASHDIIMRLCAEVRALRTEIEQWHELRHEYKKIKQSWTHFPQDPFPQDPYRYCCDMPPDHPIHKMETKNDE